ncbi:pyrimidine reductase [Flexivirga endophytica]|uniref:Pyrimidine reductase n=1 Tax=Flexivirga endophytica TaxID=1849103 RepID=A0A916WR96_9MICO|nr:dihydrofolate reductase family protein [Flexivirga endophytica]GGB22224.1 pyrimidine reductase [Flexivirga endophytica]GHB56179.1 pyrimidine reductase [Flexivirga endophytica]
MAKLVLSENVCLDGAIQDAVGMDGYDRGGWFTEMGADDYEAWAKVEYDEALGADALLMGRRTDGFFAAAGWNTREGAWADRLRVLPKYVVSSTIGETEWAGGTVLRGDVVAEVVKLKERYERDIVVYGSAQLARTLIDEGLVDQVRLTVHPFVLGDGEHFLDGIAARTPLQVVSTTAIGTNLTYLVYDVTRAQE